MSIFLKRKVFFKTPEGAAGAGPAAGAAGGGGGAGAGAGAGAAGDAGKPVVPVAEAPKPGTAGAGAPVVDATKVAADAAKAVADAAKAGKPVEEAKTLLGKEGEPPPKDEAKAGDAAKPKLVLKVPEGRTLDQAVMGKFEPLVEKYGLSGEAAQEFLNLAFENLGNAEKLLETRGVEAWNIRVKGWEAAIVADPEVGGAKLKESIGFAAKGARILGGKELIKELDDSGFGNNPIIFKALAKAGRLMKEHTIDGGTNTGAGELSQEDKDALRYPKMTEALKARAVGS